MQAKSRNLISKAPVEDIPTLNSSLIASLEDRLASSQHYSEKEILEISLLNRSLFPKEFPLDKLSSENLRALALLSQSRINNGTELSSHRKIVGPFIVFFKRLIWRFIYPPLEKTFDGISEFSSRMVSSHAELLVQVKELQTKIDREQKKSTTQE